MDSNVCVLVVTFINSVMSLNNSSSVPSKDIINQSPTGIESYVIGPLKIWHICGLSVCLIMIIVIVVCCCVDVRIPRPRNKIEKTYKRRKLHRKYGENFFSITGTSLGPITKPDPHQPVPVHTDRRLKIKQNNLGQVYDFKNVTTEEDITAGGEAKFALYTGKSIGTKLGKIRPVQSGVMKSIASLHPKTVTKDVKL